jgi:pimeloyl-[acyl-carrier protein] methyl ester esterase
VKPRVLACHGWGLDAALWAHLAALTPQLEWLCADRGYFGPACWPDAAGAVAVVGHSLGGLVLAQQTDLPLVVINGFDAFTGVDRMAPRVLARMQQRFASQPQGVLDEFLARLGGATQPIANPQQMAQDLARLASDSVVLPPHRPVLVLQGDADPLLPPAMRNAVFPTAQQRQTCAGGGHLLPLTHAQWCAKPIVDFVASLCP